MNLVSLDNISHQYSERVLLENASLLINDGDRIGLIGPNGSGKTTLLRIIAGEEPPRNGRVTIWGHVRIQYVPQEPILDDNLTVLETVFQSDAPHMRLLRDYELVSEQLSHNPHNTQLQERLLVLSGEMDRIGGWTAESEAKTILTRLGITQFEAKVGTLSGGQRKRVALAHSFIAPADLLILDEPTNHIDADTIAWLEEYLNGRPGGLLMVTHDRYFLGRVVNRIVELDRRQLVNYPGNYERYLEQRTTRHEQQAAAELKRQNLLRRELEWLRRGAQARSTKQKARIQRVQELQQIQYDRGDQRIAIALASRRLGKRVLTATNLSKSYGDLTLFHHLNFELNPGDRMGIIGPNGAGKSTFLDVLAGKTRPDSGTVQWGETVRLGYYDQRSEGLRDDKRVIEFVETAVPLIQTDDGSKIEAAQMLEWFLFNRKEQQTYIGSLSGGERRRLYLLSILVHQPNVLFLDEPTNDLDIQTLTVLEQFLDHFQGCLVAVSHDRYFLDRNVDFLVSFEDGVLGTRYPAPYETYRRLREEERGVKSEEREAKSEERKEKGDERGKRGKERQPADLQTRKLSNFQTRKLTWKEQRELESLEQQMTGLTDRVTELEAAINSAGGDYVRLPGLVTELEEVRERLTAVEERWLELSEFQ